MAAMEDTKELTFGIASWTRHDLEQAKAARRFNCSADTRHLLSRLT